MARPAFGLFRHGFPSRFDSIRRRGIPRTASVALLLALALGCGDSPTEPDTLPSSSATRA